MQFIMRVTLLLGGLLILLMVLGGYFLRQEPSTAYWVLSVQSQQSTRGLYLVSPNGGVRHTVVEGERRHDPELVGWLPSRTDFLYKWEGLANPDEIRVFHLYDSARTELLTPRGVVPANPYTRMVFLPNQAGILLLLQDANGVALFHLDSNGRNLSQVTDYYARIDTNSIRASWDGQALFFQAAPLDRLQEFVYREPLDGGPPTQLFEITGTTTFSPNSEGGMTIIYAAQQRGTFVYRLPPDSVEPELIFDTSNSIFFAGQFQDGTLLFSDPAAGTMFQMRPDSTDQEVIFEGDIFSPTVRFDPEAIYYGLVLDLSASLLRRDLTTLQDQVLLPEGLVDEITLIDVTYGQPYLLFEAVVDGETRLYRINKDGTALKLLATFDNPIEQLMSYLHPDWLLLIVDHGTVTAPRQTYYRVHVETGETDELVLAPSRIGDHQIHLTPVDGEIIITVNAVNPNEIRFQYRSNLGAGSVEPVYYGTDLSFSGIIDAEWQSTLMFLGGIGMLLLSAIWGIWCYYRATI